MLNCVTICLTILKKVGQEALGNTILSTKTGVYISVCGEILSVAFQTSKIQSQSFTQREV